MVESRTEESLQIVVVGHVDHGKSTIIGRLLADTGSLPKGRLEAVKAECERNSKRFEYAFLLDALADERAQGITIETARVFFKTEKRRYLILDAPGHIEFLKNMVTGASRAAAALLVIDAFEGVQENSRRHGYLLSMLGVEQVAVLVNKMDLVGYRQEEFVAVVKEYARHLDSLGVGTRCFVPVSGTEGDNISACSDRMNWYEGQTVLQVLDSFRRPPSGIDAPFRMYVQDVYKFTRFADSRRIVAGTVSAGSLTVGQEVVFLPSGKRSRVKSLESGDGQHAVSAAVGEAIGFSLEEQVYVTRGELAVVSGQEAPQTATRIRTRIFWLGKSPLHVGRQYFIKIGTAKIAARAERLIRVVNASTLEAGEKARELTSNNAAECIFALAGAVAFDAGLSIAETNRFVIVDDSNISGGGIIAEALDDRLSWAREDAHRRDTKWIGSLISPAARAERYNQKPVLLLITGERVARRKDLAKVLEAKLFSEGKVVYFLGIGSLIYGLDADLQGRKDVQHEHIRRLAEVANIVLDAGVIFIVTAARLTQDDLEMTRALITSGLVKACWLGEEITTDIDCDLHLPEESDLVTAVEQVKQMLCDEGVIFKAW